VIVLLKQSDSPRILFSTVPKISLSVQRGHSSTAFCFTTSTLCVTASASGTVFTTAAAAFTEFGRRTNVFLTELGRGAGLVTAPSARGAGFIIVSCAAAERGTGFITVSSAAASRGG
jgi:hypothetical protein